MCTAFGIVSSVVEKGRESSGCEASEISNLIKTFLTLFVNQISVREQGIGTWRRNSALFPDIFR